MKIDDKILEIFKDHVATYKDLGEVKILDWSRPNSGMYRVRYIFDGCMLYISGDLGCYTYWLTWNGTPESFEETMSLGYFYSKVEAIEGDKYDFDSDKAKESIREHLDYLFGDFNDEIDRLNEEIKSCELEIEELEIEELDKNNKNYQKELDEINESINMYKDELSEIYSDEEYIEINTLINDLCNLTEDCSSLYNWAFEFDESNEKDILESFDQEYWEWIYDIGKTIPYRAEMHLAGIILANRQLKGNKDNG